MLRIFAEQPEEVPDQGLRHNLANFSHLPSMLRNDSDTYHLRVFESQGEDDATNRINNRCLLQTKKKIVLRRFQGLTISESSQAWANILYYTGTTRPHLVQEQGHRYLIPPRYTDILFRRI